MKAIPRQYAIDCHHTEWANEGSLWLPGWYFYDIQLKARGPYNSFAAVVEAVDEYKDSKAIRLADGSPPRPDLDL